MEHGFEEIEEPTRKPRDLMFDRGNLIRDVVAFRLFRDGPSECLAHRYQVLEVVDDGGRCCLGRKIWVPAADSKFVDVSRAASELVSYLQYFETSTGWAAGEDVTHALIHALFEIIERDALSAFLLNVGLEDPSGFEFRPAHHALNEVIGVVRATTNSDLVLRSIPSLAGYSVIVYSDRRDAHNRRIVGSGASETLSEAALRAVLEYEQDCAAEDMNLPFDDDSPALARNLLNRYPFLERSCRMEGLDAGFSGPPTEVDSSSHDMDDASSRPADQRLAELVEHLTNQGYSPMARVVWRSSSDSESAAPAVVHALIPGFERFHLVRHGVPLEPIGRLRSNQIVKFCREQSRL